MSLPCLFKTAVVRSSRSYAAVVRSCCYQLFFVVVKEALFMRSTWLFHPHPPISTAIFIFWRLSSAILRLSSGYLRAIFQFLAAIFGYLAAIFRLSPGYLRVFLAILRLSLAIFRLSTGYLCLSSRYLPPILDFSVLSFN